MSDNRIPGRADTLEGKRLVVERILTAWMRVPDVKLSELIDCAGPEYTYLEDLELATAVEKYVAKVLT